MIAASGCVCLLVILASLFVPGRGLLHCAVAFVGGWFVYAVSWAPCPYAPVCMLNAVTGKVHHVPEIWAVCDCLIATYILTETGETWAGLSLFALFVAQGAIHFLYKVGGLNDTSYLIDLNAMFVLEAAVFLTAGAGGIADYAAHRRSSGIGRRRHSFLDPVRLGSGHHDQESYGLGTDQKVEDRCLELSSPCDTSR